MTRSRTARLALTLLGFAALGLAAARPVAAQGLTFTLSGVTFKDGATASGYFDYNPAQNAFGSYDITTTDGATDGLLGTHYTASTRPNFFAVSGHNDVFAIYANGPSNISGLVLDTSSLVTGPATVAILPGQGLTKYGFSNSGELTAANDGRLIKMGRLIVTEASAVPEPPASTSFAVPALMLAGLAVAARRRRTRENRKAAEMASA